MNTRLYVGNLSFNTNADGVRTAFQEFGTVSDVHLVSDRGTGRSRGFAFVTMGTPEEAAKSIEGMDGKTLDGRPLRVNEAEQRRSGAVAVGAVAVEVASAAVAVVVMAAAAVVTAAVAVVVAIGAVVVAAMAVV